MNLSVEIQRAAVRAAIRVPRAVLRRLVGPAPRSPEGYVLDLEMQLVLWFLNVLREPELHEGDLKGARRRLDRASPVLDVRRVHDVVAHDTTLPGGDGLRRTRVYVPARPSRRPAPALLWFHGGGFVLGSIESHDGACRALASEAGVVVMSVDYRLAPEHPFPAGIDDAVAATRWVLDHASAFDVDPDAIAVGGDSAGGAIAAVVAQSLRGTGRPGERRPAFQLLFYPATDATRREASHQHFGRGFLLTKRSIDWFIQQYLPVHDDLTDPRASPLLAADVSGLPPALVVTAGFDPLRDEGRAYAERMRAAGVEAEHVSVDGAIHGFLTMAGVLHEPARILQIAADHLRRALVRSPAFS